MIKKLAISLTAAALAFSQATAGSFSRGGGFSSRSSFSSSRSYSSPRSSFSSRSYSSSPRSSFGTSRNSTTIINNNHSYGGGCWSCGGGSGFLWGYLWGHSMSQPAPAQAAPSVVVVPQATAPAATAPPTPQVYPNASTVAPIAATQEPGRDGGGIGFFGALLVAMGIGGGLWWFVRRNTRGVAA